MISKALSFCCLLFLIACSPRNLTYLSDLREQETKEEEITNDVEPRIQVNDILDITITSLSAESNVMFNSGIIQVGGGGGNNPSASVKPVGYQVDKNGYVLIPVLGKVHLAGLTKEEAKERLTSVLSKYARDPIVDMRYMNFKITVIGEVNNPSTFTVPHERINVLEALGLAGDMTPYGKRENVLILREQDGKRITSRVNLNNKEVLNSPYFYLQQNDIVYVEPDKVKAVQVSPGRANFQFGLSVGLALLSVVTILVTQVF
ncbi:polysaccharide biosynthesis/export family protein [Pontibacter chinhatensis]|uniref:Polysaccharide export outer membrane protein n=1 Tax=Pontibacter chinhatensis TaxID=1436961 RepID=A0A1I2WYM7_9BACT|nr:polysaccharide biosynthesis/export family protein [Pontibacter chinhatensis]SFH06375.1 polysaccharide export outer membrane protein [Pontibacter chinhatensis]